MIKIIKNLIYKYNLTLLFVHLAYNDYVFLTIICTLYYPLPVDSIANIKIILFLGDNPNKNVS